VRRNNLWLPLHNLHLSIFDIAICEASYKRIRRCTDTTMDFVGIVFGDRTSAHLMPHVLRLQIVTSMIANIERGWGPALVYTAVVRNSVKLGTYGDTITSYWGKSSRLLMSVSLHPSDALHPCCVNHYRCTRLHIISSRVHSVPHLLISLSADLAAQI